MALLPQEKTEIMQTYQRAPLDTGSPEVQIAVLTKEIERLSQHLQTYKKDYHSQRGLIQKVGRRKRLMVYLKRKDPVRYQKLIESLGIRG